MNSKRIKILNALKATLDTSSPYRTRYNSDGCFGVVSLERVAASGYGLFRVYRRCIYFVMDCVHAVRRAILALWCEASGDADDNF